MEARKTCTYFSQLLHVQPGHALLVGRWPRRTVTMPPLGDPGAGPSNALREKHTEPEGHFTRVPWTGLAPWPGRAGHGAVWRGTPGVGTALPAPHRARFTTPTETGTLTPGPVLRVRNRGPLHRS